MNARLVSRLLSVVPVTGMEKRLPSSSMKSMCAVKDMGLGDMNDTTTGSRSLARPASIAMERLKTRAMCLQSDAEDTVCRHQQIQTCRSCAV